MTTNNTGVGNSGDFNSGNRNSGYFNSGNRNSGDFNSGDSNSGNWNSGNRNSGNRNSGNSNSGNWNSGYWNSGYWNSGNRNSGNSNSGNWNSGYWNSGNRNSGNSNSGNWNSGYWNSGYCNSDQPKVRMFNKTTDKEWGDISFPDFFYYTLSEWISDDNMTDKEKDAYPSYVTCKGYLKVYTHEQAWRNAWDKADVEDRKKCLDLPNWDNEIFKEISGIDVEKELSIRNDVKEFTLQEIADKLGVDVSTLRIKE